MIYISPNKENISPNKVEITILNVMDNVCVLSNSYVEALTLNMTVFGGRALIY